MNWASSLMDDLILRRLEFEQVHAPQLRVEVLDRLRQSIKLHPHSLSFAATVNNFDQFNYKLIARRAKSQTGLKGDHIP